MVRAICCVLRKPGFCSRGSEYSRVALQRPPRGIGKKYVVTIIRCIRTENFPLREIGTWEKVPYNGGYAVNGVRCNNTVGKFLSPLFSY